MNTVAEQGSALLKLEEIRDTRPDEIICLIERHLTAVSSNYCTWYRKKKRSKQLACRCLHFVALVCLLGGGICPLLSGIDEHLHAERVGYVLLASAGGLMMFDRLFGLSQSWMRYMVALQKIEARYDMLRIAWLRAGVDRPIKDEAAVTHYIQIASEYLEDIHGIVGRETALWVNQFGGSIETITRRLSGGHTSDTLVSK